MRAMRLVLLFIGPLTLSGCGALLQQWEGQNNFMVAAVPLCESRPGYVYDDSKGDVNDGCVKDQTHTNENDAMIKQRVANTVLESELKCSRFLNGLVLAENSSEAGLDGATTLFSALGTAFTPIATVHAFTAASTVSSGWRANIDADIYGKHAIEDYSQAIESTYYTNISTYLQSLNSAKNLTFEIEAGKIAIFHKACALASARGQIQSSLKSSPSAQATTQTITVGKAGVIGTNYVIATASGSTPALSASYPGTGKESIGTLAQKLANTINSSAQFITAGVTATVGADKASIVLHIPGSLTLTWTATPSDTLTVKSSDDSQTGGATTKASPPNVIPGK